MEAPDNVDDHNEEDCVADLPLSFVPSVSLSPTIVPQIIHKDAAKGNDIIIPHGCQRTIDACTAPSTFVPSNRTTPEPEWAKELSDATDEHVTALKKIVDEFAPIRKDLIEHYHRLSRDRGNIQFALSILL